MESIKVIRALLTAGILTFLLPGGSDLEAQAYGNILSVACEHEACGRTDSALQEAYRVLKENESSWFDVSKYIIRLNNKKGYYTENIRLFREAHKKGYFYFIHPRMAEYEPYLSIAGFDTVSSTDLRLREVAISKSKTIYSVELPEGYDPSVSYPVIFILHGGSGTIHSVRQHWQVPVLGKRFIKVYLQSYRHFDFNTFGWGTGDARLDSEVRKITDEIFRSYNVNFSLVFAAGISAGATAATDLAIRNVIPATGVIAYCPDVPGTLRQKPLPDIPNRGARIYIWAGENDYFIPGQKVLIEMLDSLGIACKYVVEPGTGHSYPADESRQVAEALRFTHGWILESGSDDDETMTDEGRNVMDTTPNIVSVR